MRKHSLTESLLSSSAKTILERQRSNYEQGEEDLYRLNRKIGASLPQLQKQSQQQVTNEQYCLQVFNPQSTFVIIWQIVNICLIYIYFIEIPIAMTFNDHRSENQMLFETLNFPVIALFIIGIFVNLNTGFYYDGRLQNNPKLIRRHYIKNNLVFDVISISAIGFYEFVEIYQIEKDYLKFTLLFFFLRLKELLQVERLIVTSYDLNRRIKAAMKLFLLMMKILLVCNVVACSGFFLSHYLYENNVIDDKRQQVCGSSSYWIISTCQAGIPLRYNSFGVQYIYSLYWAATTMITIGYGDITPKNVYEILFNIIIQFLSCVMYGYAINVIWGIIQELNSKKIKIHSRLNTINVYMRDKEIGSDLIHRINGYLTNYYLSKNLREKEIEAQIIGELTPALKVELYHQSYKIVFKHKFFQCINDNVIIEASQHVKQVSCFQDQSLASRQYNISPCLYYIKKGELRQLTGGKSKISLRSQYKDDYVGLFEFVSQLAYMSELTANKYTRAYYIKFHHWRESLLDENEQCFEYFYLVRERLVLYHELDRIGYSCYFCASHLHRSQLCFDQYLRALVLKSYSSSKQTSTHQRRAYARRKFQMALPANFPTPKQRKISLARGPEHLVSPTLKIRHASMFQSVFTTTGQDDIQSLRKFSDDVVAMKRGGKLFGKHKTKHENHKFIENLQEMYENRSDKSQFGSSGISDIMFEALEVDTLALFDEYYPRFNASELNFKDQRRRLTKSIYHN